MTPGSYPGLPPEAVVTAGIDVQEAWEAFHFFEATHHAMDIMNPMSSEDLDALIAALAVGDGARVVDIACGHGELLLRIAAAHEASCVGVDLSPWQIARAIRRTAAARLRGSIEWRLGRGEDLADGPWDVAACIGASWIWGGFAGTAAALAEMTRAGGRLAIADVQLREGVEANMLPFRVYDGTLDRDGQLVVLESLGLRVRAEMTSSEASWRAYDTRVAAGAMAYAEANPGEPATTFLARQRAWDADHAGDSAFVQWAIWVAQA